MPKADTWMPFYPGDYLRDTMHLTRDEHGAYMLLLIAYWMKGGPLPGDEPSLATICRATIEEWQRTLKLRLAPFFTIQADGRWGHKRVDEELERANRNIDQKKRAGRASANARTNVRSNETDTPVASCVNTSVATSVERTYQRTEGEGEGEVNTEEAAPENPRTPPQVRAMAHRQPLPLPPASLNLPEFTVAWAEWQSHIRQKGQTLTAPTAKNLLSQLSEWGPKRAAEAINFSIRSGWTSVHESRVDSSGKPSGHDRPPDTGKGFSKQREHDQKIQAFHDRIMAAHPKWRAGQPIPEGFK